MQQMNSNRSVKIVLPNILGYERIAMACSASFAQMNGLAADRIEDLKTIVAEAATNAMQHGNKSASITARGRSVHRCLFHFLFLSVLLSYVVMICYWCFPRIYACSKSVDVCSSL